jgi:hypothetical protein
MLVPISRLRVGARRLVRGTLLLLPLAACSGGDLLLPDGRQLRAVSGDGQSAVVGSPVPNPLVVEALDADGRPVEGAVIVFEFVDPPNGAAIAPPVTETASDGRAAVEVTLGTPAGDQPVEARLDDPQRELSVRFLLTAIPSNDGGGGGDDDDPPPDDGLDGGGGGDGPPDDGGGGGGGGGGDDDDGERGGDDDNSGEGGGGKGDDDKGKNEDKGEDEDNSGNGDDDRDDDD